MEIQVSSQTFKAVQQAIQNKSISQAELEGIEQTLAEDKVLTDDERHFLQALKDHQDITIKDGTQTAAIPLARLTVDFVSSDLSIPEAGPVAWKNHALVSEAPAWPSAQEIQAKLRQNPVQALEHLNHLWQAADQAEGRKLLQGLPDADRILLAKASLDQPVDAGLSQVVLKSLEKTPVIKTLLAGQTPQDTNVLAQMIEKMGPTRRKQTLPLFFDGPRWDASGQISSKYNAFQPTMQQQIRLLTALMKTGDAPLRADMIKLGLERGQRLESMRTTSEVDPTGMDVKPWDRNSKIRDVYAQQRLGRSPEQVAISSPHASEYTRRAEILEQYLGEFPRVSQDDATMLKPLRPPLQAAIADGLANRSTGLIHEMKSHPEHFSHEDLSGALVYLLNPPNPEASKGFYQVIKQTLAEVQNPALSAQQRQKAAYALGKYMGAAVAAADRLPEPAKGLLYYAVALGLDLVPGLANKLLKKDDAAGPAAGTKPKSETEVPDVPGPVKEFMLEKVDKLVNGKEQETVAKARQEIWKMQDDLQILIGQVDSQAENSELEQEFIAGRDFYLKHLSRLGGNK